VPARSAAVSCLSPLGFHRMVYRDWGAAVAPAVLCVHGLTRNGRDFDWLATALETDRRVVCPDVVGRGASDRLALPEPYAIPQYAADMATLIAALDVRELDWVGTSMGGLIGMALAAQPGTPIRRMVINDVGPFIPKAALERIGQYVGADWRFADLDAAEAHMRRAYAPFGNLSDAQWRELTRNSVRQAEDGMLVPDYDPGIAAPYRAGPIADVDLWGLWDRISCPVLVLRGANSDLLLPETLAQMRRRGPRRVDVLEFPDCGHAPALMDPSQIGPVRDWLLA